MTNPTIKIHNLETGEELEREMTASELKQYEASITEYAKLKAQDTAKSKAKAELLAKLGITEEQAKLLLF